MTTSTALILVPVGAQANARFKSLSDELLYAWDGTDVGAARQWSLSTAAIFGSSLKRRAANLFTLARRLGMATSHEAASAVNAYRQDRLADHVGHRAGAAHASSAEFVSRIKVATSQAAQLVRSQPREAIPQLLVLVVTSIVVSGGPDGDGGAPDLDLMFGIDAHRSILSHSILMGAALETGFLSLLQLVRLLHAKLPVEHDPLWDRIARHADSVAQAASAGASIGMSYHLLVDGLLQPGAYHDLPVSMPIEAHQAAFVANAVAEAVDVAKKPISTEAITLTERKSKRSSGAIASTVSPPAALRSPTAPPVLPPLSQLWWKTASAAELAAANAAHHRLRAESVLVDPFVADMLADAELAIIERYGSWLEGLATGTLRPLSAAQERFVQAAKRQRPPETPHEQAWMMYQGLREYAPKPSGNATAVR